MGKKILVIGPAHPYRGGLASFNERMSQSLQEEGHEVSLITFSLQYPSILFPGKTQYSDAPPPKGLKIRRLVNAINPFNWVIVGWKLAKLRPDIVIVRFWLPFMGPSLGTISRIIRRNKHTKIIGLIDNIIPHEKRIGDTIFTKYFTGSVDGFLAMSKSVLAGLNRFDTKKPRVLSPHPMFDNFGEKISRSDALERLGLSPNHTYLLFFGFVRKYKGLDILLDALPSVIKEFPSLRLIIAGEYYDDEEKYRSHIRQNKLEEHCIVFNKFISDSEVKFFFCASEALVLPYKSATQSGVTQISYHFDTPMIISNVGGLAEHFDHMQEGLICQPNAESVAQGILKLCRDEIYKDMSKYIETSKQKFSWQTFTKSLLRVFDK